MEPPPSRWHIPPILDDADDLIALGADLEPGTILAAYRHGLFPMPVRTRGKKQLGWWSPDPRGVIPLGGLHVGRSLRRSCRRFTVTVDAAFDAVVAGCADPARSGRWIDAGIAAAYRRLHDLGWVHSVEVWNATGALAGGLYGVLVGRLFAGESMFHRETDASKVALVHLEDRLRAAGAALLDVQWATEHLRGLGAIEIPRTEYLDRVVAAAAAPTIDAFRE